MLKIRSLCRMTRSDNRMSPDSYRVNSSPTAILHNVHRRYSETDQPYLDVVHDPINGRKTDHDTYRYQAYGTTEKLTMPENMPHYKNMLARYDLSVEEIPVNIMEQIKRTEYAAGYEDIRANVDAARYRLIEEYLEAKKNYRDWMETNPEGDKMRQSKLYTLMQAAQNKLNTVNYAMAANRFCEDNDLNNTFSAYNMMIAILSGSHEDVGFGKITTKDKIDLLKLAVQIERPLLTKNVSGGLENMSEAALMQLIEQIQTKGNGIPYIEDGVMVDNYRGTPSDQRVDPDSIPGYNYGNRKGK